MDEPHAATGWEETPHGPPSWAALPVAPYVLDDHYHDAQCRHRFIADASMALWIHVTGRGTIGGTRALLATLQTFVDTFGKVTIERIFIDLSGVDGGPLRAQVLFGKWLFGHRKMVGQAAIYGAKPFERRMAAGVMKIARLKGIRFFKDSTEALAWLHADGPGAAPHG